MSTENVTARPPSPKAERGKFRRVTPPETLPPSPPLTEETQSRPVPAVHPPSSDDASPPHQANRAATENSRDEYTTAVEQQSPPKGLWQWATAGSRLGMLAKMPHPHVPLLTSKAAISAVNGALEGGKEGPKDDFSVPSSVSTEPHNEERREAAVAAKMEGLGIANSTVEQRSLFSQTKRSSDDLVASMTGTPSPQAKEWTNGEGDMANGIPNAPTTPSPAPRRTKTTDEVVHVSENTPSPHRIPKYKIALTSNILSSSLVPSAS